MNGHGQFCCNGGRIAILLDCQIEILCVSGYSDIYPLYVYLLAKITTLLSETLV